MGGGTVVLSLSLHVALVKEKHALALKREQEEHTRRKQMELEEAFKKKSDEVIPDHVCSNN